jgi:5-methyltetrahydropteroyltriglutamate--homocysteine methyltransferase
MGVLRELGTKEVLVGVVDVGTEEVESADVIAGRIRGALAHVPAARLMPCTDCGLVPRSRESARGKMRALAEAAAIVRAEMGRPHSLTAARHL